MSHLKHVSQKTLDPPAIPDFREEELKALQTWEELVTDPMKARTVANAYARVILFAASQMTNSYFDPETEWDTNAVIFPIVRDAIFTALAVGYELGQASGSD